MLDESFAYAKECVWERWKRWLLLMVSLIVFPLILGYMVKIFRGDRPAPDPAEWGSLFINGLKLLLVQILYFLPVILLAILAFVPMISALIAAGALSEDFSGMSDSQTERWLSSHPELLSAAGTMVVLLLLAIILAIIIPVFSFIGVVRFARTESIGEAFHFSAILARIGRIGWINYIIALLVITVIGFIFGMLLNMISFIPKVGDAVRLIAMIVLYVPFLLFSARYCALVYDEGEEKILPAAEGTVAPR